MDIRSIVATVINNVIEETRKTLRLDKHLNAKDGDALFVGSSGFDSFTYIHFVSLLESELTKAFGREIMVVDDEMLLRNDNPMESKNSLVEYLTWKIVNER